jgi:mono/diheme cytochrome c family protein
MMVGTVDMEVAVVLTGLGTREMLRRGQSRGKSAGGRAFSGLAGPGVATVDTKNDAPWWLRKAAGPLIVTRQPDTTDMKYLALSLLAATAAVASADEAQKAKLMEAGKTAYATCMACHAPDGKGLAIPPDKKMAPSLAESKIVTGEPAALALAILKGIQKDPANAQILGIMAPLELQLDDDKLAGVMTYVRNSFGNTASVVTPEDAKKFREQFKDIKAQVTRAQLEEAGKKK